jgi:ubiquinone/menaquinone biosynthesis C-methylase UbiE
MAIADYLLYRLARNWPSPMTQKTRKFGAEPGTDAYEIAYSQEQFDRRVQNGIGMPVFDRDVLEVGCGHGGISCFLAACGARRVVGIDLNLRSLEWARKLAGRLSAHFGPSAYLPVEFLEMDAYRLTFDDEAFDVVVSENSFEHFVHPEQVMREAFRVLRPGGTLLVPIFSSIYSKYGLHLKHGLKLPWANLFWSEKTIIRAMYRLAAERPELYEFYPGLNGNPMHVRDLRKHGDLNDITHRKFKEMALRIGFEIDKFRPLPTHFGLLIRMLPVLKNSILSDIYSLGATALLTKPVGRATLSAKADTSELISSA